MDAATVKDIMKRLQQRVRQVGKHVRETSLKQARMQQLPEVCEQLVASFSGSKELCTLLTLNSRWNSVISKEEKFLWEMIALPLVLPVSTCNEHHGYTCMGDICSWREGAFVDKQATITRAMIMTRSSGVQSKWSKFMKPVERCSWNTLWDTYFHGVTLCPQRGLFRATIGRAVPGIGSKETTERVLGFFPTPQLAATCHDIMARRLYGEGARVNFPDVSKSNNCVGIHQVFQELNEARNNPKKGKALPQDPTGPVSWYTKKPDKEEDNGGSSRKRNLKKKTGPRTRG